MKTILVPTDFSALSKVGVSYGIALAKKIDAKIIVISIVTGVTQDRQEMSNVRKFQDNMLATAQSDGERLLKEFEGESGSISISFQAVGGFPIVDVIEKFAVENGVDLIIMGSKGATGLKKIVMGSNATAVIDNSSVPVLIIPGEAKLDAMRKLVYATDAQDLAKEMKIVMSFAELLGASVEVVHVMTEGDQKAEEIASYPQMHLNVIYDKDVASGLETFITSQREDFILITFTHRLSFNEKLFGKSVTQKLAFHSSIPLLVVNGSNQKGA